MAKIKIEDIVDYLDFQMRCALSDAVRQVLPGATYDDYKLFREFKRAIDRKCNTWEKVPNHCVSK